MAPEYKIRVKVVVPVPDCAPSLPARGGSRRATDQEKRDAWVILGKPVTASAAWTCGTDLIWPVLDVEGIPNFTVEPGTGHMCRHQFIAGD